MNLENLVSGVQLTGHTGSAYGLYSAMFFNPKKKFGFVVITNSCKVDEAAAVNPLSKDCINILYNHFIK
ncbi:MAG TPA: serine hydrolase, partial [Niabella sp.]|nr:serine hydrolase [Niabella sp.]